MMLPTASPSGPTGGGALPVRRAGKVSADLRGFGMLSLAALLVGLGINQMRHRPLPLVYHAKAERLRTAVTQLAAGGPSPASPSAPAARPREVALEEFQAFVARKGAVIDARGPYFYGAGHVPGAINLPREDFQAGYVRQRGLLEARRADAVAVYCSGADCEDARLVADALGALGFRQLLVYKEGWDEWSQSGLPQEK